MKKHLWGVAAALALCALLPTRAQAARTVRMPEEVLRITQGKENEAGYVEMDDYINLATAVEGTVYHLQKPLVFGQEGELSLLIKVPLGGGLAAKCTAEGVEATSRKLQNTSLSDAYDYYALRVAAVGEYGDTLDDTFTVDLKSGGESLTLKGYLRPRIVFPLYDDADYSNLTGTTAYTLSAVLEEEARVEAAKGFTVAFKGNYGQQDFDLYVDTALLEAAVKSLGEEGVSCYRFVDRPVFQKEVAVRLSLPEGAEVYEYRAGGLYRISTSYRGGAQEFKTDYLGTYVVKK